MFLGEIDFCCCSVCPFSGSRAGSVASGACFAGSYSKNVLFERFSRAFCSTGEFSWALSPGSTKPKKPDFPRSPHLRARSLRAFRCTLGLGGVQNAETYIGGVSLTVYLTSSAVFSAGFGSSGEGFRGRPLLSRGTFEPNSSELMYSMEPLRRLNPTKYKSGSTPELAPFDLSETWSTALGLGKL